MSVEAKGLIEEIATQASLPSATVRRVVRALAGQVHQRLEGGGEVVVPGLGKFVTKDRPARTRQSADGKLEEVPARRVVHFKAKPPEAAKPALSREERQARKAAKVRAGRAGASDES